MAYLLLAAARPLFRFASAIQVVWVGVMALASLRDEKSHLFPDY